jgi:hypothetical protein
MSQFWIGYAVLLEQNFHNASNGLLLLSRYLGRHASQLLPGCSHAIANTQLMSFFSYLPTAIHIQQNPAEVFLKGYSCASNLSPRHLCFVRLDISAALPSCLYPIVGSDMTAFKKSAYRAKAKSFAI